jgi:hypothetical protein
VLVTDVAQVGAVFKMGLQLGVIKLGWSSLGVQVGVFKSGVVNSWLSSFDGVSPLHHVKVNPLGEDVSSMSKTSASLYLILS